MFSILNTVASSPAVAPTEGSFWFPPQSSSVAPGVDWLFDFILWIALVFFVLIVTLLCGFVMKYHARKEARAQPAPLHHTALEVGWTIIPTILVVVIFYFGAAGYMNLRTPPGDAREVQVTGQKWNWSFTYPNGVTSGELHVPVNEPVRLVMRSEDVIHSMYIPAFRVKMDVVPGRYTTLWFTATDVGEFRALCAEYCGTQHSGMMAKVVVQEASAYARWLADAGDPFKGKTVAEVGSDLFSGRGGCIVCHSVDGSKKIGPSLKGVFGSTRQFLDGTSVTADENYLRESIMIPTAKVVAGFAPVMPTFQGKFSDKELTALITYIKTLK